eukprot:TRINITY_DN61425_c0_g1_i5.p1 TRINITY_DN61425_c0_g1~~TRINITY_DN61425_c0_g1_i5.p1  ORF type:complete len:115 (+),score=15.82 TRINITY_DN61425_c0_g1_i5:137-481(+)
MLSNSAGQFDIHQTVVSVQCDSLMLATVRFLQETKTHTRQKYRYLVVVRVDAVFWSGTGVVDAFLSCCLLMCGDIEPNPGPLQGMGYENRSQHITSQARVGGMDRTRTPRHMAT